MCANFKQTIRKQDLTHSDTYRIVLQHRHCTQRKKRGGCMTLLRSSEPMAHASHHFKEVLPTTLGFDQVSVERAIHVQNEEDITRKQQLTTNVSKKLSNNPHPQIRTWEHLLGWFRKTSVKNFKAAKPQWVLPHSTRTVARRAKLKRAMRVTHNLCSVTQCCKI